MEDMFQKVIVTTVRQAKRRTSLLWADRLAEKIAEASVVPLDRSEISDWLTREAIRQGLPVVVAPDSFDPSGFRNAA